MPPMPFVTSGIHEGSWYVRPQIREDPVHLSRPHLTLAFSFHGCITFFFFHLGQNQKIKKTKTSNLIPTSLLQVQATNVCPCSFNSEDSSCSLRLEQQHLVWRGHTHSTLLGSRTLAGERNPEIFAFLALSSSSKTYCRDAECPGHVLPTPGNTASIGKQ